MNADALAQLHQVSGRQTTILTHYGRKTGNPHQVTIWFVLDGDKLYLTTANVNRQWVKNVQKNPQIKLSIAGENFTGAARLLIALSTCGVALAHSRAQAVVQLLPS